MRLKFVKFLAIALMAPLAAGVFSLCQKSGKGPELRGPASSLLRAVDSADYGPAIESAGEGGRVWALRSPASKAPLGESLAWAVQYVLDLPRIAAMESDKPENGAGEEDLADRTPLLAPLLAQDGAGSPGLLAALPQDFNDALDSHGRPLRWRAENLMAGYTRLKPKPPVREEAPPQLKPLPSIPKAAQMGYYRSLVENFSKRYNLSSSLVMAIIHSESDFSPAIVSNKSAMGLMQLLPSTASDEVHRFLYGRRGRIGFEDLRNPEINIRYGTAYLHILLNRYFPNVQNRNIREVCAIASYNLGPNRFLRLYGRTNDQAVEKINTMSEEEFYTDLIRRLPARETRFFVQKVRRMKSHYSGLP